MKSQSKTQSGFSNYFLLVLGAAVAAGIYVLSSMECYTEKRLGFDFSGNCREISEAANYFSRVRGDGFVIDAGKLRAFYNTKQPISFWFERLTGESYLSEGKDYVVINGDGEKQRLLTFDAVLGMAAKSIENTDGFFESQEARVAKRLLACLREPHFNR